jgi:hypothetical protein
MRGPRLRKPGGRPSHRRPSGFFCTVATQGLLLCISGTAKPDDATAHGLPLHSAPSIPREVGQRTSKNWILQVTVSQLAPIRLTKICPKRLEPPEGGSF